MLAIVFLFFSLMSFNNDSNCSKIAQKKNHNKKAKIKKQPNIEQQVKHEKEIDCMAKTIVAVSFFGICLCLLQMVDHPQTFNLGIGSYYYRSNYKVNNTLRELRMTELRNCIKILKAQTRQKNEQLKNILRHYKKGR